MRYLIKYLKPYVKESIIGPLFKLLEACFELMVPLVMARIIDIGIKNQDTGYISRMCVLMVFLGILGLACSLTAQYFAAKAAVGFGTELRKDFFAHINGFSYARLDTIGTSTLVTRVTSDINQIQTGVNLVLRLFLRSPFIVIGAVIMAFTIDVKLAWIFVIMVPLLSIIIYGIMLLSIPIYRKVQTKLDRVLLTTRENLTGARVVRTFARQEDEKQDFLKTNNELAGIQITVGKIAALLNPVTYVIINGGIIMVLWLGSKQVYGGIITQGELIALINYMSQILIALIALSTLIISYTKALASAARVSDVFQKQTSIHEGVGVNAKEFNNKAPKIEYRQVDFAYENANADALSDISFAINSGETVGVIGGTGSGKSTLVNLIPRFYDAKAGVVLVDGYNVKEYDFNSLRNKIGVVPQNAVLFKGTIRENIQWGKEDASDDEINHALDISQAKEFVYSKQEALDTMILQGGKNLSGGQRQRLTIARAIVSMPEILILDDSASALDFATDAKLRTAIGELPGEMTVFIVSQRASSIKNADKIIVMDDGCVVGIGKHDELYETCSVYKEICLSQLSEEEVRK